MQTRSQLIESKMNELLVVLTYSNPEELLGEVTSRELSITKTKIEEAIMWANKYWDAQTE